MNILVDTSVWSLLLHRKKKSDHLASLFLQEQIAQGSPLAITGIIYQEVLQGVRSESHFHTVKASLVDFDFLEPTPIVHEEAAQIFRRCRGQGIQGETIDYLIAALAIHYQCPLLTTDKDFEFIAKLSDLELLDYTNG